MHPEGQTTAGTQGHTKVWTASNVFSVLAMGVGSIGYGEFLPLDHDSLSCLDLLTLIRTGYSANVIAPILGKSPALTFYVQLTVTQPSRALTPTSTSIQEAMEQLY